jgi:hypothetical protein
MSLKQQAALHLAHVAEEVWPRIRMTTLGCLGLIFIALMVRCWADSHPPETYTAKDVAREANIAQLLEDGKILQEEAGQIRDSNDVHTIRALVQTDRYKAARSKVVLKSDPAAIAGTAVPTPGLTPEIVSAIAQADTAMPMLTDALAEARRGSDVATAALVPVFHADSLKNLRIMPKGSRCGRKCGITLGVIGTVGTFYLGAKIIHWTLR